MLRRTIRLRLADVYCDPLISGFEKADAFHTSYPGYLADLYTPATPSDPFSPVLPFNGSRYMVSAPVTIGKQCLRTPFLIDTGANRTLIHRITIEKFGKDPAMAQTLDKIAIGHHTLDVGVNNATTVNENGVETTAWLGYLNLMGVDFLAVAVPELPKYLSENLSRFQPPLSEFLVTDGKGITFPVTPKHPQVMDLKLAIKEYGMFHIAPFRIIIKDPSTGKAMGDEDALHVGVEYVFELPPVNT